MLPLKTQIIALTSLCRPYVSRLYLFHSPLIKQQKYSYTVKEPNLQKLKEIPITKKNLFLSLRETIVLLVLLGIILWQRILSGMVIWAKKNIIYGYTVILSRFVTSWKSNFKLRIISIIVYLLMTPEKSGFFKSFASSKASESMISCKVNYLYAINLLCYSCYSSIHLWTPSSGALLLL